MASPLVSVITVFYNRAREVALSVGSLLEQTQDPLEIIVVDDGSTDGTVEALQALSDSRLRLVLQKNRGFVGTLDEAVRSASGRYIAIHGSGDISAPERLAKQAALLDADPTLAAVGCIVDNEESDFAPSRRKDKLFFKRADLMGSGEFIHHGEVMFRKDIYEKAGGYRPLFTYGQDHDLWLRMLRHGNFRRVPEQLYVRRRFANAVNASPLKLMLQSYFSDFAVQCAREGDRTGRDFIEKYGNAAPFFHRPSPHLSRKLTGLGLRALVNGDEEVGRLLIETARAEGASLRSGAAAALARLSVKRPPLWQRTVKPAVRSLLRKRLA